MRAVASGARGASRCRRSALQHRRRLGHARRARGRTPRPPARPACPGRRGHARRARCGPGQEGPAAAPYIRSSASAPGLSTASRTGTAAPPQAAGAAVDAPRRRPRRQSSRPLQRQRHAACARPAPRAAAPAPRALSAVRLATYSCARPRLDQRARARRRPRRRRRSAARAGPAARRRRCARCRAPGRCRRCCRPSQPSASKRSTLAACASAARGVTRARQRAGLELERHGDVAAARRPLVGKGRAPPRAKPSSGHSTRAVVERPGRSAARTRHG